MKFLRPFHVSFTQAVDYYALMDKKLAMKFIESVEVAKKQIMAFPKIGKRIKTYRVVLLNSFPYSLCYCEWYGQIVALVLFHHKQSDVRIDWRGLMSVRTIIEGAA